MSNEKKQSVPQWEVHSLDGAMQNIHRQYGLWLIGASSNEAPVNGFHSCLPRYFEFYSLSHLHQGHGRLWLESGEETEIGVGDAVLITPRSLNRYGGSDDCNYCEDAIRFCGPVADMLRNAGVIRDGVFHLGMVRRLLPIFALVQDPAADAQINANIALQQLLVDMYNENRRQSHTSDRMAQIQTTLKRRLDHWWTIKELCEICALSDDQLRRMFLAHTGMLPKNYIEQLKMHKAVELLMTGRHSIQAIAHLLGYVDQFHFSRRFKHFTGVPPSQYRSKFHT